MIAPSKGCHNPLGCLLGLFVGGPLFMLTFFIAMNDGSPPWPFGAVWGFFLGWLIHWAVLIQSFPHIWPMVLALAILVAAGLITTNFIIKRIAARFQLPALTESGMRSAALCLIPFGAIIAGHELAQHARQLIRADTLLRPSDYVPYYRQESNARQLVIALYSHASDRRDKRFPEQLSSVVEAGYLEPADWAQMYWYALPDGEPPAPWIYVRGLGLNNNDPGDLPLLIAPRTLPKGKRIIAFRNQTVEHMSPQSIKEALPKWKAAYAALGVPLPFVLRQYEKRPGP